MMPRLVFSTSGLLSSGGMECTMEMNGKGLRSTNVKIQSLDPSLSILNAASCLSVPEAAEETYESNFCV